jgi:hypothetical protein
LTCGTQACGCAAATASGGWWHHSPRWGSRRRWWSCRQRRQSASCSSTGTPGCGCSRGWGTTPSGRWCGRWPRRKRFSWCAPCGWRGARRRSSRGGCLPSWPQAPAGGSRSWRRGLPGARAGSPAGSGSCGSCQRPSRSSCARARSRPTRRCASCCPWRAPRPRMQRRWRRRARGWDSPPARSGRCTRPGAMARGP